MLNKQDRIKDTWKIIELHNIIEILEQREIFYQGIMNNPHTTINSYTDASIRKDEIKNILKSLRLQ